VDLRSADLVGANWTVADRPFFIAPAERVRRQGAVPGRRASQAVAFSAARTKSCIRGNRSRKFSRIQLRFRS